MKINRQQLLLEFLSVVFAVLLALLLNSWRESAARDRTIAQVKDKIREEVEKNDIAVREALDYHELLLSELTENRHVVRKLPIDEFPVDVTNDKALSQFVEDQLLFEANQVIDVEIVNKRDRRVLIIDGRPFRLEIDSGHLVMYGIDNIRLRYAGIRSSAWQLAQATGVSVDMDLEVLDALARLDATQTQYRQTANKALEMLYTGEGNGIVSVLQDIYTYEQEMIQIHEEVLERI